MNNYPSYPSEPASDPAGQPPVSDGQQPAAGQPVAIRLPQTRPYVVYVLLAVTVLVFILQMASEWFWGFDLPAQLGMKVNEYIVNGQLWRLFTPMLLHGSILHIAFNLYALNIFGPGLERHYGHARFLALYVLAGFAGNVMSFVFSLAPSLGSSTAIFGLLGAEGVFLYQNRELFGSNAQRALTNIITIAVINLVIGLSPGIDNWGHIGGLIGGALYAWVGGPLLGVQGTYPALELTDKRSKTAVVVGWGGVMLLFALLAAGMVISRQA